MRKPRHGEIDVCNNHAAYLLYQSRHEELPLLLKEVEVVDEIDYLDNESIKDSARMIWKLMDELEPLNKRILVMVYELELNYTEIANQLSIRYNKIKRLVQNALDELKTIIIIKIKFQGLKLDFMSNINYGEIYNNHYCKDMETKNFRSLISKHYL